jgi:hypothetical protein
MNRFFNIAGPCIAEKHYLLPSLNRLPSMAENIEKELFFVIHAARQSGKTTLLKHLEKEINEQGKYIALYCSLETVQEFREPQDGIPAIMRSINKYLNYIDKLNKIDLKDHFDFKDTNTVVGDALSHICKAINKPLVMFFDEVDCLSEGTLVTFLRQLREGYINRGSVPFIHSLALVGMRNIRDYKYSYSASKTLGSASPFNIVSDELTLKNFTNEEIAILYQQHAD